MFIGTTDPEIARAVRIAHKERSQAFTGLWRKLFSVKSAPLGHVALTGASR